MILSCKLQSLSLARPIVMGILNVTPDSFSDGNEFTFIDNALARALEMREQGAQIIDIGGESTRPGAKLVTLEQELARVIPIIKALKLQSDCLISIDTSKPEVMRQAVEAGADIINDVRALQEPGALEAAAQLQVPVCLMHMQGQPENMQDSPNYHHLIGDIVHFFEERISACLSAGIERKQLILDPGFGFGKTLAQNYELLGQLGRFKELMLPLLVGLSRKSMIGDLLKNQTSERLVGSVSCALIAAQNGAQIIRVHDVKETVEVLTIMQAVRMPQKLMPNN